MTYKLTLKVFVTVFLLALLLAACAPRTQSTPTASPPAGTATPPATASGGGAGLALTDPAALEVDRAAREAFHLMGLEYARTGSYSVNVLVSDLTLPSGARWELADLKPQTYALRFTSDNVPEVAWLVTPTGVTTERVAANQIY